MCSQRFSRLTNEKIPHRVFQLQSLDLSQYYEPARRIKFDRDDKLLRLKSAVVHKDGRTIHSGHFVTYVFLDSGEVLLMDDQKKKIVRKRQLLQQDIDDLELGAYLLFYEAPVSIE